jgi:hypothetical protein
LLASTLSRVAVGSLANAALSGANTVIADAELSVSTSPAFSTAVTSVDSTGFADAAVATGACAIPLKLPAPDFGTVEQAGPKSVMDALAGDANAVAAGWLEAMGADEDDDAADDELPELQAAVLTARPAATMDSARTRWFTITPLR